MPINNQTLPAIDANTNRFQTGPDYRYDANGNLIQDYTGRQFTFDGDNKQTLVKDSSNNPVGQYFYDGSGKRVKKVTNTETVIFVYDSADKLVAEYSTAAPVPNPTVSYTATDSLGSPRVVTNKQGQIISRKDFMPFGEELAPDATYRTTNLKYGAIDNVRQKFTGYQRDDETGLDFAEARYYNSAHGRFTAVDPLLASGKSANPQTFNRYVYTLNRPLNHNDPTGLQSNTAVAPGTAEIYRPNVEIPTPKYVYTLHTNCPGDKCTITEINPNVSSLFNRTVQAIAQNIVNSISAERMAEAGPTTTEVTLTTKVSAKVEGTTPGAEAGAESTTKSIQTNPDAIATNSEVANTAIIQDARTKVGDYNITVNGETKSMNDTILKDGRTATDQFLDSAQKTGHELATTFMRNQAYPGTRVGTSGASQNPTIPPTMVRNPPGIFGTRALPSPAPELRLPPPQP